MVMLASPLAFANKKKPELWSGEILPKAAPGSIVVAGRHIRLRNRATPREIVMLSDSNDNQQFLLWVVLPVQHQNAFSA